MDERTASESTHDLLLALAGRVDDDMLGWARELVAVGEDARAVELLTASLLADGAGLPEPVHAALVAAARSARIDLDAAALQIAGSEDRTVHRFDSAPAGVFDVAAAVRALPARQLRDCRVLLTWRLTPAGSAPGPLPHPVVLVEVDGGGPPTDVLAYQLAVALDRAGSQASVEVLTTGRPLSAYHAAALRDAVPAGPDAGPAAGAEHLSPTGSPDRAADGGDFTAAEPITDVRESGAAPAHELLTHGLMSFEPPHISPFPPGSDPLADPLPPLLDEAPRGAVADDRYDGAGYAPEEDVAERGPAPDVEVAAEAADAGNSEPDAPAHEDPADDVAADEVTADHVQPEHVTGEPFADDPTPGGYRSDGYAEPVRAMPAPPPPTPPWPAAPSPQFPPAYLSPAPDHIAATMPPSGAPEHPRTEPEPGPQATAQLHAAPAHRPGNDTAPRPPVPIRAVPDAGGRRRKPPSADEANVDPTPRPAPRPIPGRAPQSRRPTVTPISRTSVPSPIPLVRRDGSPPAARPLQPVVNEVDPPAAPIDEQPLPPPQPAETPAFAALDDPLNGPLNQPLLAPLLEPTILEHDPLGLGDIELADSGTGEHDHAVQAPGPGGQQAGEPTDARWANEWASGSWAMAPSALGEAAPVDGAPIDSAPLDGAPIDSVEVAPAEEAEPIGHRRARHRSGEEPAEAPDEASSGIVHAVEPEQVVEPSSSWTSVPHQATHEAPAPAIPAQPAPRAADSPAPDVEAPDVEALDSPAPAENAELVLRPESLARLSDADRELLARLQAELGQGRKPRVTRRAGVGGQQSTNGSPTNGSGPTNGHGSGPPDLAG